MSPAADTVAGTLEALGKSVEGQCSVLREVSEYWDWERESSFMEHAVSVSTVLSSAGTKVDSGQLQNLQGSVQDKNERHLHLVQKGRISTQ